LKKAEKPLCGLDFGPEIRPTAGSLLIHTPSLDLESFVEHRELMDLGRR
jgi:hypothetical protein